MLVSGCAGISDKVDRLTPGGSSEVSAAAPVSSAAPAAAAAVSAQQVVDAFAAAGLPAPSPRDNSKNCPTLGCREMVTTDAVTVLTFDDTAAAAKYTANGETHQRGMVVLSYTAARTPAEDRPRYEQELAKLVG